VKELIEFRFTDMDLSTNLDGHARVRWTIGQTLPIERLLIGYPDTHLCLQERLDSYPPDGEGPVICVFEFGEPEWDSNYGAMVTRSATLVRAVDVARELVLYAADCIGGLMGMLPTSFDVLFPGWHPELLLLAARAVARGILPDRYLPQIERMTWPPGDSDSWKAWHPLQQAAQNVLAAAIFPRQSGLFVRQALDFARETWRDKNQAGFQFDLFRWNFPDLFGGIFKEERYDSRIGPAV
jgi:hypothetical protein